jgi:hypothetical protein
MPANTAGDCGRHDWAFAEVSLPLRLTPKWHIMGGLVALRDRMENSPGRTARAVFILNVSNA